MIRYLLDTDSLTLFQYAQPMLVQQVLSHPPGEVGLTIITVEEQLSGWYTKLRRARRPDDLAQVYQHLTDNVQSVARFPIVSFTRPAIQRYALLRTLNLNVAKWDLRIAAIALEQGGIVITRNLRDFQRIPGLIAEDWSV
jgi:tRNA(fMet)-specific endonuclease VapC